PARRAFSCSARVVRFAAVRSPRTTWRPLPHRPRTCRPGCRPGCRTAWFAAWFAAYGSNL
ncbi:hypothetical protein, partial [Streptomyces sp. NPDC005486]|uniref:hypothetical protein n=1 Tax=Streptomyces sp. NPDC005486 TaxID=3155345 RepID=UPI0033A92E15